MRQEVAIVGIGTTGFRATSPDVSYRQQRRLTWTQVLSQRI